MASVELQLAVQAGNRAQRRIDRAKRQSSEISRVAASLRELGSVLGLTDPPRPESQDTDSPTA